MAYQEVKDSMPSFLPQTASQARNLLDLKAKSPFLQSNKLNYPDKKNSSLNEIKEEVFSDVDNQGEKF